MERTTIYIPEKIKKALIELSFKESKNTGKRASMVQIIRDALILYLAKQHIYIEESDSVLNQMLKTKGMMSKSYEKRVKKTQKEFNKWKIPSV
jgi:hypothetical protein